MIYGIDRKYMEYSNRIPDSTIRQIKRMTAKYLFVKKDGSCKCEYCETESTISTKTTHKRLSKCPSCHKTLTVIHTWRNAWVENIGWGVTADCLDDSLLLNRYVLVYRVNGEILDCVEAAREVLNFRNLKERYYENRFIGWQSHKRQWYKGTRSYFREFGLASYSENRWCCRGAIPTRRFWNEARKLEAFKYFNPAPVYRNTFYPSSVLCSTYRRVELYEKMQKCGLDNIIAQDLNAYSFERFQYDSSRVELSKMLKINKGHLKLLTQYPNFNALKTFQAYPNLDGRINELVAKYNLSHSDLTELDSAKLLKVKILNYLHKNHIEPREYTQYIETLKKLGYPMDNQYMYPKDFRKEDTRLSKEYDSKKNALQDSLIKELSDGLRKLPNLSELLDGSKGFLVKVPECQADLDEESKALHNCIRTYGERLAEHKTILFFIRRLEAPNAPFVAMEYCNGSVVQCRYDNNVDVRSSKKAGSDKIIEFAELLAHTLAKNKILCA